MHVAVTGGSGFIGSHLLDELRGHGHRVTSVDVRPPRDRRQDVRYCSLDVCEHGKLRALLGDTRPDAVCHLAAIPSIQASIADPFASMTTNLAGTCSVLEAARHAGCTRMVFASSAAVYGMTSFRHAGELLSEELPLVPLNPYSLSKKSGEELMRLWASQELWHGIDTVSLRLFNVFGPRQRCDAAYATCIERFLMQWQEGSPFTIVPDGRQRRDLVFVADVVRAMRLAVESPDRFGGDVVNIGSGRNYSVLEIADVIGGPEHPRVFIEPRPGEVRSSLAAIERARARLGWRPEVSFPEGIEIVKRSLVSSPV